MKRMIIMLLLCCTSFAFAEEKPTIKEGQQYLADAQLAVHHFFTSEEKSVMDVYSKLAAIRNAVKKDETLKNKEQLLEILQMNKDVVTSLRKGLDSSWIQRAVTNKAKEKESEVEVKEPDKPEKTSREDQQYYNEDNWWKINKVNKRWKHFLEYKRESEKSEFNQKTRKYKPIRGLSATVKKKDEKTLSVTLRNSTSKRIVFCTVQIKGWIPPATRGWQGSATFTGVNPKSTAKTTVNLNANRPTRFSTLRFNVIWLVKKEK